MGSRLCSLGLDLAQLAWSWEMRKNDLMVRCDAAHCGQKKECSSECFQWRLEGESSMSFIFYSYAPCWGVAAAVVWGILDDFFGFRVDRG